MKPEKHIQISTFNYKGQDFDVLVNKNEISYIFELGDTRYGNKVRIASKKRLDTVNAVMNLLINFIETYEASKH